MIDDAIEEKHYADKNEIVAWHFSHAIGIKANRCLLLQA